MMEDIDKVFENLPLLVKNKNRILSNEIYSQCKVRGTGIYFANKKHIYIGFTLGNLLKLWTSPCSSWRFGKKYDYFYSYKMTILKNGFAEVYSKNNTGTGISLYDEDICVLHIEDAVRIGKVRMFPKSIDSVIEELKGEECLISEE